MIAFCFAAVAYYFPASGAREKSVGSFILMGEVGHSWCTSSEKQSGAYVGFVRFTASEVAPFYASSRSYALQVRCVQAFTLQENK